MNVTERTIFEQFPLWESAPRPAIRASAGTDHVVVGCGSSYNLAMSLAAVLNERGFNAIAVPGNEWLRRPRSYTATTRPRVVAISRSGESSELVLAAQKSRRDGLQVTAITCDDKSSLVGNATEVVPAVTHPEEGIVMTASASLMLLLGLGFAGIDTAGATIAAQTLLHELDRHGDSFFSGRAHFVYLGAGALYGVAAEGALKLQEMSSTVTQTYHPLEYRHGPISVIDERSLVVMLYHPDTRAEEEELAKELSAKGAFVVGIGGKGDLTLPCHAPAELRGLVCLPALQLLGMRYAQLRDLDTTAPRHLSKVVKIG